MIITEFQRILDLGIQLGMKQFSELQIFLAERSLNINKGDQAKAIEALEAELEKQAKAAEECDKCCPDKDCQYCETAKVRNGGAE